MGFAVGSMAYHKAKEAGHEQVIRWHGRAQGEDRGHRVARGGIASDGERRVWWRGSPEAGEAEPDSFPELGGGVLLRGGTLGIRVGPDLPRSRNPLPRGGPEPDSALSGEPGQDGQSGREGAGACSSSGHADARPDSRSGGGRDLRIDPVQGRCRPAGSDLQDDRLSLAVEPGATGAGRREAMDTGILEVGSGPSFVSHGPDDAGSLPGRCLPAGESTEASGGTDLRLGEGGPVPGVTDRGIIPPRAGHS